MSGRTLTAWPRETRSTTLHGSLERIVRNHVEAPSHLKTADRNGAVVSVGTTVRVLALPEGVLADLSPDEVADVESMKSETFSVYEIDQYGFAWVEKWWTMSEDQSRSHSLALAPAEMEVVTSASSDA